MIYDPATFAPTHRPKNDKRGKAVQVICEATMQSASCAKYVIFRSDGAQPLIWNRLGFDSNYEPIP